MKLFGMKLFLSLVVAAGLHAESFMEQQPGKGVLTFTKKGTAPKTVELGKDKGYYGMGFLLKGEDFEKDIAKELKGKVVLQISLLSSDVNTTRENAGIATLTLVDSSLPTRSTQFSLSRAKPVNILKTGTLEFHAPFSQPPSPEQKLQSSFYQKLGKVKLAPAGVETTTRVVFKQSPLELKTQNFQLDIDCLLMNPYDPEGPTLKGTIEIPVYWPQNKASEAVFKSLSKKPS